MSIQLLEVTPEALAWRDLSASQKKKEHTMKVSLLVVGLLCLAGGGIVTYLACHSGWTPYSNLEVLLSFTTGAACLAFAYKLDFDRSESRERLKDPEFQELFLNVLKRRAFKDLLAIIYRKPESLSDLGGPGGFSPFVHLGYFSPEEADKLRVYAYRYQKGNSTAAIEEWWTTFRARLQILRK